MGIVNKDELLSNFRRLYLDSLLKADRARASKVIDQALSEGLGSKIVYLQILLPSQVKLGELWHEGKISVAEEHLATEITLSEMSRLRERMKPKPSLGVSAVIGTLHGDEHGVGAHMVADFLYLDGWEVHFLGANVPPADFLAFVKDRKPNVVGISLSLRSSIDGARDFIPQLKKLEQSPKILIGGRVVPTAKEEILALGADAVVSSADEAVHACRKLVGLAHPSSSIEQYLRSLGNQLREERRKKGLSQQEVADAAGLDRAYLSAVEHGKHNVTVGALLKLSDALEIGFEELLINKAGR